MISIDEQQELLIAISKKLKKKITVYAIGGNSMMYYGLKEATKDIDLVFENEKERNEFKKAAEEIGYIFMDSFEVYGKKRNHPEMIKLGDVRIDMFIEKVIHFTFSDEMKKRSENIQEFGNNLIIKIADIHDIILMKCATDRIKDKDDVINILKDRELNWEIIIKESENQIKLGTKTAAFELGCFLEELRKIIPEKVPKNVLDNLFKIVSKQVD